ncbi:MAG: hypothetical protein CVV25_06280 [Ignavibacteriae bacterium HGW-Ignavibacteriae-4]|jgi:long-subunit fatty acid transport protein|nr:MAG: hypothetical protein CVV25_06280 [Ignavibacteriae bacterium HGW-Ignavibacteriae-4]
MEDIPLTTSNMMKTILLITATLFISNYSAKAQSGGSAVQSSAVPFLMISPDARASGMGEVGTAIADDVNAIYWNPGGLAFLDYFDYGYTFDDEGTRTPFRQVALAFSPWLPQFNADLYYSYGTIAQHFDEIDGTVAFNFIFMNLGEFKRTLENSQEAGTFTSNEFSFGFSYGTIIAPDLGFGFQLRYIQSNLTPTGQGSGAQSGTGVSGGFDVGLLWKPSDLQVLGADMQDRLSLGMNLQNVGPKMTYINEADPLPTNLKLGIAYDVVKDEFNKLTFAFDYTKLLVNRDRNGSDPIPLSFVSSWQNNAMEYAGGVEYWYEDVVALRAGYFTEPDNAGARKFWNFGAGVRYDIFRLDFSFINTIEENHPLANTLRFSLLADWE